MSKKIFAAAIALAALPMVVAQSSSAAEAIDAVCQKGASEPALTWYTSQDPTRGDAVVEAFGKKYPKVKVEALRLVTGKLAARFGAERSAGLVNAGIISLADPIFIEEGFKKGWFEEFAKADFPALASLDDRWFAKGAATTSITILGIAYNPAKVGEDAPRKWEDLIKPKFKGQIVLGDPRSVPSYMALARIWREKFGDDYLKKLAAQGAVYVPSVVPVTQQLAAGELTVVAPNVLAVVEPLKKQGAKIEFAVPEITTGNEFVTVLAKGSTSANAAKCLYNFLFTTEGQKAYNGETSVSPMNVGGMPLPASYIDPKLTELPAHEKKLLELLGLSQ